MRTYVLATLAVFVLAVIPATAQVTPVPLEEGRWTATPGWTPADAAATYAHGFTDGIATFTASDGGGTMIWLHNLDPKLEVAASRYLTIRYRVESLDPTLFSYLLYVDAGDESGFGGANIVAQAEDIIHDGQWHTAVFQVQYAKPVARMGLRFCALRGERATFQISRLEFSSAVPSFPLSNHLAWQPAQETPGAVDLSGAMATALPALQAALSLSDWFTAGDISAGSTSFHVPVQGPCAVSTPTAATGDIEFALNRAAAELHLLIGTEMRPLRLGYHGWQPGDRIWRPSEFLATITYADNGTDQQMPYCVEKADYGLWRGVQVYALNLDPERTVRSIRLHEGMKMGTAVHLLAATTSHMALIPERHDMAVPTPAGRVPLRAAPQVSREGDRIIASTTGGKLVFDLDEGLAIVDIVNNSHADWGLSAAPVPLFTVLPPKEYFESDTFEVLECTVSRQQATITLRHQEASLGAEVTIRPLVGDEFAIGMKLTNTGAEKRRLGLSLAQVAVRKTSAPEDLWYFYPAMAAAWSNLDRSLRPPHNGGFPVQWMDAYDRTGGGGVYVATRDTQAEYRWFCLGKHNGRVQQAVEYYDDFIGAGETRTYPDAIIGVHAGDWRIAQQRYQDWLRTWCTPLKPRLQWFREVWNFRTHWTHTQKNNDPQYNWYLIDEDRYQAEKFITQDNELFGRIDMNHFFDWRISKQYGTWGDYSHFEDIGGLDRFRAVIRQQQEAGIRVGLYMDAFLCSKKSEIGLAHGEEWAIKDEAGRYRSAYSLPDDPMWSMCIFSEGWPEYLSERCAWVAETTGCDGIYLDEGGMGVPYYWCWRDDHGHPVPANAPWGFRELARMTREKLPEGKALYTEHCPPDVTIPYMDGGYSTAMGRSDWTICPGFLHTHRFAFPDFKVLPITSAGSIADGIWDGLRYSLFNGCGLYTLSYGHDPEAFDLCRKISAILQEHSAAFCTLSPEAFVDTLRADVYANRFPAERETVWTLWNGRWETLRGPVLRVPHAQAATYRDVYNEVDLSPAITDGMAEVSLTIGPRDVAVVVQRR